jgi:hypothetical protein
MLRMSHFSAIFPGPGGASRDRLSHAGRGRERVFRDRGVARPDAERW